MPLFKVTSIIFLRSQSIAFGAVARLCAGRYINRSSTPRNVGNISSRASRQALGPSQRPIQCVRGLIRWEQSGLRAQLNTSPPPMLRSKMSVVFFAFRGSTGIILLLYKQLRCRRWRSWLRHCVNKPDGCGFESRG